jgi:hypothetical protein
MKSIYAVAATAALTVLTLSVGEAAPKPTSSSATQARIALEQIDARADSIVVLSDEMAMAVQQGLDPARHLEDLSALKEDVNRIGIELQSLDAEDVSLAEWETTAVAQVTPIMEEIAATTKKSIEIFNSDRNHLWTTSYPADVAKVYADAKQVKGILDGYLKLASVREEERRLEVKVGESSSTQ